MRRMNNMMNSFIGRPFGNDMFGETGQGGERNRALMPFDNSQNMLSPFGFPNMNQLMGMNLMTNDPNCHSFSSSSVMTMTTGPDGKPQVYNRAQYILIRFIFQHTLYIN